MYKMYWVEDEPNIYDGRRWWSVHTWRGNEFFVTALSSDAIEDALRAMGERLLLVAPQSPQYAKFLWDRGEHIYKLVEEVN